METVLQPVGDWHLVALGGDLALLSAGHFRTISDGYRSIGQYAEAETPAGRAMLAMTSAPGQPVEFLIRGGGQVTDWLLAHAGEEGLRLSGALGKGFETGDLREGQPVLLVATGTGIGPMRPLFAELARQGHRPVLLYGVRHPADAVFSGELQAVAGGQMRVRQSGPGASAYPRGYVTDELTAGAFPYGALTAYLCGVPASVEAVRRRLMEFGTPAGRIRVNF